jgi:membrane protein YdbS with pleckstrin-like domain
MRKTFRPAWRKQWFLGLVAIALLAAPIMPLAESLRSGAALKAVFDPRLLWLGLPFVIVFLILIYRHYSWRFTIADGSIESRHGIIAREVSSMRISDVRNINVKQTLFERLFFIGDIEFSSAASDTAEVVFKDVSRPMRVKRRVQEVM